MIYSGKGPCTPKTATHKEREVKNTKDRTVEWTERDMGERGPTSHNNKKNKQTRLERVVKTKGD